MTAEGKQTRALGLMQLLKAVQALSNAIWSYQRIVRRGEIGIGKDRVSKRTSYDVKFLIHKSAKTECSPTADKT